MTYSPKVNIDVQTAVSLIPTAGETVTALIGTAQYGRINEVVTCTDFNSVLTEFKEDKDEHSSITKAAEIFFANGGTILKIVRIADSGAAYATLQLTGAGAVSNVITINSKYKGSYGNNIMIDIDSQGTGIIARIKNGDVIETFDNNGNANGYTLNSDLVDAINNDSSYVTATLNDDSHLAIATASYTQLTSGDDGSDGITASDYTTVIDNILNDEDWDILLIPSTYQSSEVENSDSFHSTILSKIETRAATYKKYSLFLSGIIKNEDILTIQARTTRGSRFVLCAPSVKHISRRVSDTIEVLDGTFLACALAGTLSKYDNVSISPTRKPITVTDLSVNTVTGKLYYNNTEIEQLLSSGVCAASNINKSNKWARGITRIADTTSIYFEINIVRIVDQIKTLIQDGLDDYLGEPNSEITRSRMQGLCNGILQTEKDSGILNAFLPTVITQGTSPDTVNVSLTIKPAYSTNFINVLIVVS